MVLDFEQISREFVRVLRGKRSQTALSRRLGYRTNVIYAWESGRRFPTAATLLRGTSKLGFDVRALLKKFFATPPSWLNEVSVTSREGVARLLEELRGNMPVVELARRSGFSRYAIARWLAGAAEPRLPDFLRLFEAASLRLLDFIALFHDPGALNATSKAWKLVQAHRQAVYDLPWIPAVLHALELDQYRSLPRHREGWIAEHIGITLEDELRCLTVLAESGQIRKSRGLWHANRVMTVDTRQDANAERKLKEWWARVGIERLTAEAPGLFSFNVFAVSKKDLERLRELHRSYFRQLRSIVAASSPSERVCVANVQLFALGGE
jgi:transcriptional regulator with XRE-family HTH domain